ncbi:hypothetical protein LXL04_001977 [Taraxacum kok-saghyz]
MKKSQLSSPVFFLLITLSFSLSWDSLSSILDVTPRASSEDVLGCLLSHSHRITSTSQLIFTPANTSFLPVWQASFQNTRFLTTPKPSVIVTPVEETLVQTTLLCAKKHGYELKMRSGGHDCEGLSYSAYVPFVMIDFTNMRSIDVNGNILDRKSMGEDLFWAIRGGGVSSFGIILAWKLSLVPSVAPYIDRNLLIRTTIFSEYIGNSTKKTVKVIFEGIYQGTTDTLLPLLDEEFPELGVTREICQEMRSIQSSLVSWGLPLSTPIEILSNRSAIAKVNAKVKSDYVREPIPISGLRKIWRKLMENDESAQLIINPFGGKIAEFPETAIPYPHRAGVLFQLYKAVNFNDQTSDTTPISMRRRAWLQTLDELLKPYVSSNPREACSNYNDLDLGVGNENYEEASVWGERYWKRDNFRKLIRIKAKVDPDNFFRHPQSVPVFSNSFNGM